MTTKKPALPLNEDYFMLPEWMKPRAEDQAAMDAHSQMRNSVMLEDEMVTRFLNGVRTQRKAKYFDGFSIVFGVDQHGTDFVLVQSDSANSPNLILMAKHGWVQ